MFSNICFIAFPVSFKRSPFAMQNESFWLPIRVLLYAETSPFAKPSFRHASKKGAGRSCGQPLMKFMLLKRSRLGYVYLPAHLVFLAIELGQIDGQDAVAHLCTYLLTIDVVGQKQSLFEVGIEEVATQIVLLAS